MLDVASGYAGENIFVADLAIVDMFFPDQGWRVYAKPALNC